MSYLGDPEEGGRLLRDALRYDPLAPDFYHELLAEVSYMCRDYENAIQHLQTLEEPACTHAFAVGHMPGAARQAG